MSFAISPDEKKALLADARETIAAKLERRETRYETSATLQKAIEDGSSALCKPCGAFVSLHMRPRQLRGCIGRMIASDALQETVRIMALEAAFDDPRFPPLKIDELGRVSIEISALSPMKICKDPQSVQLGIHGLYLKHQGRSGVLLPQVPVQQGWNRQEYLDYICAKAGLPRRSYDEKGAELYTFTAVVFSEEE
jgi:AmmeMemoRadiSam system protein A